MFSSEKEGRDDGVVITTEGQLPGHRIISSIGAEMELNEKSRKSILIILLTDDSYNSKNVWVLATKNEFNGLLFMQALKKIESSEYKIQKKVKIDASLLAMLYDRKVQSDAQKQTSDSSVVVLMFESIIKDALNENISDVHIEVRPSGGTVRMRKNGEMMTYKADEKLSYIQASNLCSVMYNVLASTKGISFDPRECQQAAVNYAIDGRDLKLRYQSVPAYPDGYDVILRLLPVGRSEDFIPLQRLGYTEQQVEELLQISSRPVGSLIIAGVTGSGKSTTLKNLLMYINANNDYRIKIYSIEDPPEYNIARITQIPVVIPKDFDPTKMSPFEKPIKACMRGDPDIIMIGEVRDKTTGDLTKKAVQSGHQVLTTVHATSALGTIDRFEDFGLSRSVLGSPDFLTGLLYQKLLPIVCPHCSNKLTDLIKSNRATTKDIEVFSRIATVVTPEDYPIRVRSESGCEHCKFQGIVGRSVTAEVIKIELEMLPLIAESKVLDLMHFWRNLSDKNPASENMRGKTCMEHGFQKVLTGLVCPHDLEVSFKPIHEMLLKTEKQKNVNDDDEFDKMLKR